MLMRADPKLLNVALIPRPGVAGAAVATLAADAALAVWTASRAERIVRAGYPWRAVVAVAGLVGALWWAGVQTEAWALLPRLAARAGLLAAYVPLLRVAGVYGADDVAALRRLVRGRFGKTGPEAPPGPPPR